MTRILILGGTRYLGKAIANKIPKEDFEISTLSRSETSTDVKHFVCDRKDTAKLKNVLRCFNPHIILDMINFDQGDSEGICGLYERGYCKNLRHYIMISSFFVYNHFEYQAYSERELTETFDQDNTDGYTKRKIESELALYNSKLMEISTILRLPFVFSSDDYSNRFQALCDFALIDHDQIVDHHVKYSLLRKDDGVESIVKVVNSDPIGIADLSNNGCVTSFELLDILKSALCPLKSNQNLEVFNFPYFVTRDICLNSQKLTSKL